MCYRGLGVVELKDLCVLRLICSEVRLWFLSIDVRVGSLQRILAE